VNVPWYAPLYFPDHVPETLWLARTFAAEAAAVEELAAVAMELLQQMVAARATGKARHISARRLTCMVFIVYSAYLLV
jgi:hypothetical protein